MNTFTSVPTFSRLIDEVHVIMNPVSNMSEDDKREYCRKVDTRFKSWLTAHHVATMPKSYVVHTPEPAMVYHAGDNAYIHVSLVGERGIRIRTFNGTWTTDHEETQGHEMNLDNGGCYINWYQTTRDMDVSWDIPSPERFTEFAKALLAARDEIPF